MTVSLPYAPLDADRLAGLVFELASQLHAERSRRIALELALERVGALPPTAVEALAGDTELKARTGPALDLALANLMRVLTEAADPRAPLRAEAPQDKL